MNITFNPIPADFLPTTSIWPSDSRSYVSDFDRLLYAGNNGMPFTEDGQVVVSCVFASPKHSFAGQVSYHKTKNTLKLDVYRCENQSFMKQWSSEKSPAQSSASVTLAISSYERRPYLDAFITEDGSTVMVNLETDYDRAVAWVVSKSDGKLHFNASGISDDVKNLWISPDAEHMVYLEEKDAAISYWSLRHPTLKPLARVSPIPGIEYSPLRKVYLMGQLTEIRNAVRKQIFTCRFSPCGKTFTILSGGHSAIMIMTTFLTFNLQAIDTRVLNATYPTSYVPMSVAFRTDMIPSVLGGMIATQTVDGKYAGLDMVHIRSDESTGDIGVLDGYFDGWDKAIAAVRNGYHNKTMQPILRYGFDKTVSGGLDNDDGFTRAAPAKLVQLLGTQPECPVGSISHKHQQLLFQNTFAGIRTPSGTFQPTAEFKRQWIPLIATMKIPWGAQLYTTTATISIFCLRMNYNFAIVAVSSCTSNMEEEATVRVLYHSEKYYANDFPEDSIIEFYTHGPHLVLNVLLKPRYSDEKPTPKISHTTVADVFFCDASAGYDVYTIRASSHATYPGGAMGMNTSLMYSTSFAAYFIPGYITPTDTSLTFGHRHAPEHLAAKFAMWRTYTLHESRGFNDILLGGSAVREQLGSAFHMIYRDTVYDDSRGVFSSGFIAAISYDLMNSGTRCTDMFLKRMLESEELLIDNGGAISYALPSLVNVRPWGAVSLMRKVTGIKLEITEIGPVTVKSGRPVRWNPFAKYQGWLNRVENPLLIAILKPVLALWYLLSALFRPKPTRKPANVVTYTLPLANFTSHTQRVYRPPSHLGSGFKDDHRWQTMELAAAGFSVVEEIYRLRDQALALQMLRVPWFEKLVFWKQEKFGRWVYLMRVVAPMFLVFALHFVTSIVLTNGGDEDGVPNWMKGLVGVQLVVTVYLLLLKILPMMRIPSLFFRNFYNYLDGLALGLSVAMCGFVFAGQQPPRAFLAFSTPVIWMDAVLMFRTLNRVGRLVLLVTEMVKGVAGFLMFMVVLIFGFAFIPFLLRRNLATEGADGSESDPSSNPFNDFQLVLFEMLKFATNDFDSLSSSDPASRTVQALYTIMVSILLLNVLIALLNVVVNGATEKARIIWFFQMAAHLCEVEVSLLLPRERRQRDWFPLYFTYTMTEAERSTWKDFQEKNPVNGPWVEDDGNGKGKPPSQGSAVAGGSAVPAETAQQQNAATPAPRPASRIVDLEDDPRYDDGWEDVDDNGEIDAGQNVPTGTGTNDGNANLQPTSVTSPVTTAPTSVTEPPAIVEDLAPDSTSSQPAPATSSAPPTPTPTNATPSTTHPCAVCSKPGRLCANCRKVAYCSVEHQREDWRKGHKDVCKKDGGV
ncbi:hypothetical protein HDV00_009811 [Rhizophlyctis rosea]|nr:hypothetical protein HDV00_009811 [Rhizophlyctis rosea]